MKMQFLRVGLTVVAVTGLFAIPMQEATAFTKCRETIVNGRVVKRVCNTGHDRPRRKMVCDTYWRRGVEYRDCRRVGPPPRDWEGRGRGEGGRRGDWGREERGDWGRGNW